MVAVSSLVVSSTRAADPWQYYYFDQPQPLTLDLQKVAVFGAENHSVAQVKASLDRRQISVSALHATVMSGFMQVSVAEADRSDDGIEALVASIAEASGVAFVSPIFHSTDGFTVAVTRFVHVRFGPDVDSVQAVAILAQEGAGEIEARDWSRMQGAYRLKSPSRNGFEVLSLANRLAQRPDVEFAEPDLVIQGRWSELPNDPGFPLLWGLHNTGEPGAVADIDMNAPEAWEFTTGDADILTVVFDTGIQPDHPDINQLSGKDFTANAGDGGPVNECDGHGTTVAGCIAALINNNLGTVGIAPGTRVVSARWAISDVPCNGEFFSLSSWLVNALDWAQTIGARVTNSSFSMLTSSAVTAKYAETRNAGLLHFAAAGNGGTDRVSYPGILSSVNAVGAIGPDGQLASFSQHGRSLAFVAPGVSVFTTDQSGIEGLCEGTFCSLSGTSYSSPYAAGVAALIVSVDPTLEPAQVERLMRENARDLGEAGFDTTFGWGLVNAGSTIERIVGEIRGCQISQLVAADPKPSAEFGSDVAVQGLRSVVTARSDDCETGSRCGAVYVYRRDGASWISEAKLQAFDADGLDRLGTAVSLDGDVVVATAPFDEIGPFLNAGSVYVFGFDGSEWFADQKLNAADSDFDDQFGTAVAVQGDALLVGAGNEGNTGQLDGPGCLYAFSLTNGRWVQSQKIVPPDSERWAHYGTTVALAGNVAVVGAPGATCVDGFDCGRVYVYRSKAGAWSLQQTLDAPIRRQGENFGFSLAADDNVILVGSPFEDCEAGDSCGAVYIFEWNGNTWVPGGTLGAWDAGAFDFFGWSVAIDGFAGVVGTLANDCAAGSSCGSAYMIRRGGEGWFVDGKLIPSETGASDFFGWSVDIDGSFVMVGSRLHDSQDLSNSGAAFGFATTEDCNANGVADVCDILSGQSEDADGDGRPDECLCFIASKALADPVGPKNRMLSFAAGDFGRNQGIRVTLRELPAPFDVHNGSSYWVGAPSIVSENAGVTDPKLAPDAGTLAVASLQCDPHFRDWSALGTVHISDELIIPSGFYEIQIIGDECSLANEGHYSAGLAVFTSDWGDVVTDCSTVPCGVPDGSVDVVTDVTAILDKFRNVADGLGKARADLEPETPDLIINISDVSFALQAFRGLPYPFPVPFDPCAP